jgi:hypothetical protein
MGLSVEATIQIELVKWLRNNYPDIEIRYNKNENKVNKVQAAIDKKMGQAVAGTPDLQLLIDKNDITHILELELKTLAKSSKLNPNQEKWHNNFNETKNRKATWVKGLIAAKETITNWLNSLEE